MVNLHILPRGIKDRKVIDAMLAVPRHLFVEEVLRGQAYGDFPLPIGDGQTISQPYIVALMTEALSLSGSEKVLEVGTGSGYQAAVLSLLADRIYSVERLSSLAARARKALDTINCPNIIIRIRDGSAGSPEDAPFDRVMVTAASPEIPHALLEQMNDGGIMVVPVGDEQEQTLVQLVKRGNKYRKRTLGRCRFVKLVGLYGWIPDRSEGFS